jgi:ApaG protein
MAAYEFTVAVRTQYLEDQSDPERGHYVFAYAVSIRNTGQVTAQLISRHWIIRDANDKVEEVKGLGVVGHQPLLKPGEQFEYTSGTALKTPQGSMSGAYFSAGPGVCAVIAAHATLTPRRSSLPVFSRRRLARMLVRLPASEHGPPHDKHQHE